MGSPRIIAGEMRGRRLLSPRGREIRPTADRVKESLFNILGQNLPETHVLDLFAGAGTLGLEALSRGASLAVFVDCSPDAVEVIKRNIETCRVEPRARVVCADVWSFLRQNQARERFSLVLVDPPYADFSGTELLEQLHQGQWLTGAARLVLEHSKHHGLEAWDKRVYSLGPKRFFGETCLSFLEYLA